MSDLPIRVVVIDDDRDDFFLIKDYLNEITETKYQTEWIPTFKAAVESIKQQAADIYLIDYRLDGQTGLNILDSLQGIDLKKPMILLTGQGDRRVDLEAMQKGASDFLTKDKITTDLLERSIRYSLKRAQDQEKLKEVERFKAEKEAADIANKSKSQFLADMSHEIRTPLGAILGFAELSLDPSTSEEERIDFISVIKRSGENLLEIINDVLDLSKIEAGHLQVESLDFNWRAVINEVMDILKPKVIAKGITLSCEVDSKIPETLKSDPHRFRQVLTNLICNAIKFTDKGHVTIKCKTEPIKRSSATLVISVHDTGIGINANDQKRLFKPFNQANASLSRKYGGTGLGLDISRKLARALGGDVTLIQSLPNVGSTFAFRLPGDFAFCESVTTNVSAIEQGKNAPYLKSGFRVLLIEDAIENQIVVKNFLSRADYDVQVAHDGREGILKAFDGDFDIILMDIKMPEMDGYEATQRLRQAGFTKPIIALTAYALSEEREKAIGLGFSDYITKPIQRENLIATLNKYKTDSTDNGLI